MHILISRPIAVELDAAQDGYTRHVANDGKFGPRFHILAVSLVIRDIGEIFFAAEVIFLAFLAEYSTAEAPRFKNLLHLEV